MTEIKPVVQADIDAAQAFLKHGIIDLIARPTTEAFATHRLAAYEAGIRAGLEAAAKACRDQTQANAQGREDRADDELAFEFRGLGQVIENAIRAIDPSSIEQGGGV